MFERLNARRESRKTVLYNLVTVLVRFAHYNGVYTIYTYLLTKTRESEYS